MFLSTFKINKPIYMAVLSIKRSHKIRRNSGIPSKNIPNSGSTYMSNWNGHIIFMRILGFGNYHLERHRLHFQCTKKHFSSNKHQWEFEMPTLGYIFVLIEKFLKFIHLQKKR